MWVCGFVHKRIMVSRRLRVSVGWPFSGRKDIARLHSLEMLTNVPDLIIIKFICMVMSFRAGPLKFPSKSEWMVGASSQFLVSEKIFEKDLSWKVSISLLQLSGWVQGVAQKNPRLWAKSSTVTLCYQYLFFCLLVADTVTKWPKKVASPGRSFGPGWVLETLQKLITNARAIQCYDRQDIFLICQEESFFIGHTPTSESFHDNCHKDSIHLCCTGYGIHAGHISRGLLRRSVNPFCLLDKMDWNKQRKKIEINYQN